MGKKRKKNKAWGWAKKKHVYISGHEIAKPRVNVISAVAAGVGHIVYTDVLQFCRPKPGRQTRSYLGELDLDKDDVGKGVRVTFFMEDGTRNAIRGIIKEVVGRTQAVITWEGGKTCQQPQTQ